MEREQKRCITIRLQVSHVKLPLLHPSNGNSIQKCFRKYPVILTLSVDSFWIRVSARQIHGAEVLSSLADNPDTKWPLVVDQQLWFRSLKRRTSPSVLHCVYFNALRKGHNFINGRCFNALLPTAQWCNQCNTDSCCDETQSQEIHLVWEEIMLNTKQ